MATTKTKSKSAKSAPKRTTKLAATLKKPTIRSKPMNEQFTRQAQDIFKAAQDARKKCGKHPAKLA